MSKFNNTTYFKSSLETVELPSFYINKGNGNHVIIEHDDKYMLLKPEKWFTDRVGTQSNIPFDNYIPVNDWFHKFKKDHLPLYELDKFKFKQNIIKNDAFESPLHYQIFRSMSYEWFNLLKSEFNKSYFTNIMNDLDMVRKRTVTIPESKKAYFDNFIGDINNVKVVFISEERKLAPNIFVNFVNSYPNEKEMFINFEEKEGNFLFLVASLTSLSERNYAHIELWKPFMINVINKLDLYFKRPVVFILMGKQTHYLQNVIKHNPYELFDNGNSDNWDKIFKIIESKYNVKPINW